MFHSYTLLVTLHVVLFAYWLGGDFGVYVCSRYIVRPDLPLNERERFLEALMAIDIMPRTAIVLLPVVGLQMAVLRGSALIPPVVMVIAWAVAIAWLTVVWMAYLKMRTPDGKYWQRIDVSWRVVLIMILIWAGTVSLLNDWPINAKWIAAKLLVYAALLVVGLYLRVSIRGWRAGFASLHNGESGPAIDALFVAGRRKAQRAAWLFWALIITMAWLGISQPF